MRRKVVALCAQRLWVSSWISQPSTRPRENFTQHAPVALADQLLLRKSRTVAARSPLQPSTLGTVAAGVSVQGIECLTQTRKITSH